MDTERIIREYMELDEEAQKAVKVYAHVLSQTHDKAAAWAAAEQKCTRENRRHTKSFSFRFPKNQKSLFCLFSNGQGAIKKRKDGEHMEQQSLIIPEKQAQLKALGMTIAEKVRIYFQDPEHRREFEAWYMAEYGQPYVWHTIDGKEVKKR